ncbi:MAG TPA: hypothetical protein VK549_07830 [Acidimicrobiia bacterium]|nr:hypothetical protein [Acidimicrobiia bacterium]
MSTSFEMPRLGTVARLAFPKLLETTVIPLALFAGVLHFFGLWGASSPASAGRTRQSSVGW